MKKALLISGGSKVSKSLIEKYRGRFTIVADGGMKMLREYNIKPNLIMGDLDSMDLATIKFIRDNDIKIEIFPSNKNLTDTEICLNKLIEMDYKDIIIISARGSRSDHELANIFLLIKLYKKNILAKIVDDNNEIYFLGEGTYIFKKDNKKYLSLISLSKNSVYSTKGFKYEVEGLMISRDNPGFGISNEIKDTIGKIIIEKGKVFLIRSND